MPIPTLLASHLRRMVAPGTEALTDAELVSRFAANRDPAAFELLVWRHGPMVWATCQRILKNQHDIEDAFQATFLALARSPGTKTTVSGWLHRVAMNAALKLNANRIMVALPSEALARPQADPEGEELAGVVDEELDRLPDRLRAVFVLCCLEGRTSAEVASELGCPPGTIDSRLHTARVRLRDRLTRRGFAPGALTGMVLLASAPDSALSAAIRIGSGFPPKPAVAALFIHLNRIMNRGAITMKAGIAALLAITFAGAVWASGGSRDAHLRVPGSDTPVWGLVQPEVPVRAAPVPRDDLRGEGRIVLWRDGRPLAVDPSGKGTTPLDPGGEGKRGGLRLGPDGRQLIYLVNRMTMRPSDATKRDRVYVRHGTETKQIEVDGVSPCHTFWGTDGIVYGYGLALPKGVAAEPPVDLTADFVNWSFDSRTGKAKRLALPENVSILDRAPDGKTFLVLRYEMPPNMAPGAPGMWAEYRLGLLPANGGKFVPLTKLGESAPSEFRFSPDGRYVLGTMYRTVGNSLFPELFVFDLKVLTRAAVTVPKDARVCGSCWAPDGKRIAYIWERNADYEERMNREGPVALGREKKPTYTVTVARPDGSGANNVYTETEYGYGSIDWR